MSNFIINSYAFSSGVTIIGYSSGSVSDGTSISISWPEGAANGDLALLLLGGFNNEGTEGGVDTTASPYWSTVVSFNTGSGDAEVRVYAATVDTGTDPSFTLRTESELEALLVVLRGASSTVLTAPAVGATGMPNPPARAGGLAGGVALAVAALDDDLITATEQSGYTMYYQAQHNTARPGTFMVSTKTLTAAGAENPAPFEGAGTDDWAATTVIVNPA